MDTMNDNIDILNNRTLEVVTQTNLKMEMKRLRSEQDDIFQDNDEMCQKQADEIKTELKEEIEEIKE